jgi:hypothetical protein
MITLQLRVEVGGGGQGVRLHDRVEVHILVAVVDVSLEVARQELYGHVLVQRQLLLWGRV